MRQVVALGVLAAAQLMCACSNGDAPGTQAPGIGATAGSGLGAAGSVVGAAGSLSTAPSTTAGTGALTGTAGSPSSGAAGSPTRASGGTGATSTAGTAAAPSTAGAGAGAGSDAAGSPMMATAGTAAPAGGTGGGAAPSGFKPKCLAKGAELALIGDSWINYPLGELLEPRLTQRAQKDGALPAGDRFNDQAVAGTSLASGGLGLIRDQWPTAVSAAMRASTTVKFVVMDGGGNDVLLGNSICLDNGAMRDKDPTCQQTVMAATMAGRMLQQKMRMDGVGQAVYFFYPHVPAGGWDVLDYSLPMAKETCESMNDENYQCYFIDTREAFQGAGNNGVAKAQYIGPDGIHPSAAGDDVLADLIWKTMKDHCMAQAASSGCCTP
jgi:lysophospholipase L1-like esterase